MVRVLKEKSKVARFISGNRVPVASYHKSGLLKIRFGDHKTNPGFKRFELNH